MSDLLDIAASVEKRARALGADEVSATVSRSVQTSVIRRDGKIEQASEATSKSLVFSVLADGKYSSHSTSNLRPDAVDAFLAQAVAATRFLEPDPEHALAEPELCGRAVAEAALDLNDPAYAHRTADERSHDAEAIETAIRAKQPAGTLSVATHVGDGASETARAASNGFSDVVRDAWFVLGGELTFQDGARRPEAAAFYATRYLADLPGVEQIATDTVDRAKERIGSGPIASGSYPLILANRAAGKLLGALAGPLSAGALHQGRSCMIGKMGTRVGSPLLTLIDDPFVPRGLASRPWDGDGLFAKRFSIVEAGILRNYYVNVYYGRKLGMPYTTGGRSNWTVPAGDRPWEAIAKDLPKAIYVDGFLGGNSNAVTGDFSFGIRGLLLEHGVVTKSLSEMNVSGSVLNVFERLVAVGNDPYVYSSCRSPTLVLDGVQFSGT